MDEHLYKLLADALGSIQNQRKVIDELEQEIQTYIQMSKDYETIVEDRNRANENLKLAYQSSEKAWMLVFGIKDDLDREKDKVFALKKQIARLERNGNIRPRWK